MKEILVEKMQFEIILLVLITLILLCSHKKLNFNSYSQVDDKFSRIFIFRKIPILK